MHLEAPLLEYVPPKHSLQEEEPSKDYFPSGQVLHLEAPFEEY